MRGVKQEPGAPIHQARSMALRQSTPISIDDTSDAVAGGSGAHSSANTTTTDATFPNEGATPADTAMSDVPAAEDPLYLFGRKGRELIQAVQKLDCLGINTALPSLPKVVVVGDQSAGKSSIIEAISDITLPRSEGTCTRCPFQITTHPAPDGNLQWSCEISLQYKFTYEPGYTGGPLDGWHAYGQTEICQFATITDKAELELALRRAQVAILNPSRSPRHSMALSATSLAKASYQVDFSPNVICLEITAPNLLEMSFYDLPGAINVMDDPSQDYLRDFVEKLLKVYLSDDQALVVIACPANQDIENVTAFRYLRECKAQTRAVGVLTKPDLVDATDSRIGTLERMLGGKAFKLDGGGWYTTKQLSQSQLNGTVRPTWEEARAEETLFFSKAPWSSQLSEFADRFGVANFQAAVSNKHIEHILASLPEIVDRIQERLQQVRDELKGYPGKAANPGLEVIYDIDNIIKAITGQCSADSKNSPFRESHTKHMKHLAKQLEAAAPKVDLRTPGYVPPAVEVSDDETPDETPSKKNKSHNGRAVSVTPRRPTPSCNQPVARTPATGSKRKAPATPLQAPDLATYSTTFRLDEIKRRFDLAPSANMPDAADARITQDLAKESLKCFSDLTQRALDRFQALVTSMLDACLAESLGQRKGTRLYDEASSIMQNLFVDLFGKEVETLHHMVGCLIHRPITYGKDWAGKKKEQQEKLREGRNEARVSEHFEVLQDRGFKPTTVEERKKKMADAAWMSANISSPDFARELMELSIPLTFYELASGQLVDTIARNLDYLIYQLENRMKTQLLSGLRPDDSEHAATLLVEDPARERKRSELEVEQGRLEEALRELHVLSSTEA